MSSDLTEGRGPAVWEHGAHQLYYREEDVPRLQAAVAALSAEDQMVFLRWYLDDTSLAEMASLLGVSAGRVTERVNEVRQALWAAMGKPAALVEQEAKDRGLEPCTNPTPFLGKLPVPTETVQYSAPQTMWQRRKAKSLGGKRRDWQTATKLVIIIPLIMYIVYDFVAYFMAGGEATLSTTTGNWLVKSFWIVLAVTLLVGHLFGSATEGSMSWRHFAVGAAGLILGYLLTVMAT